MLFSTFQLTWYVRPSFPPYCVCAQAAVLLLFNEAKTLTWGEIKAAVNLPVRQRLSYLLAHLLSPFLCPGASV